MVGARRFELPTYGTQNRRATRLRYAPTARFLRPKIAIEKASLAGIAKFLLQRPQLGCGTVADGGMHQFIRRLHTHTPRQSAIDFQNELNPFSAVNDRKILRNGIFMNPRDLTVLIGKQHIQRDQRILHPKLRAFGRIEGKQHPRGAGHLRAVH